MICKKDFLREFLPLIVTSHKRMQFCHLKQGIIKGLVCSFFQTNIYIKIRDIIDFYMKYFKDTYFGMLFV